MVIRARRVVTSQGVRSASVHIRDGRILRIGEWSDVPEGADLHDAGDAVVMPGLVDTHVHCNDPGRDEWEGFESATRAAAAGGITTILDMPLNSIPATTSVGALEKKRSAAQGRSHVNVEFIGGIVPGNADQIQPLADAGVLAFKCFLTPSGVDEFPSVSEEDLRHVFPLLAESGLVLMVHAEDPACLVAPRAPSKRYTDYLKTRPAEAERSAIEMLVRLMKECPARVHVVHLSSASSLDLIRAAKIDGLPITVETCPHYLTFAAEDIPDGATQYKCAPPIRSSAERDALWTALIDGDIDLITSDHSPCPPAMKATDGDFGASWGGIASLQLSLAAVWSGARKRGAGPEAIAHWMSERTAGLAGLGGRKGKLAAGYDADIVIWDPEAAFDVEATRLEHRHPVCPYDGMRLHGEVLATYLGGRRIHTAGSSH
jgi:allantoinase